jgi:TP901 family phage tail tape measure protein
MEAERGMISTSDLMLRTATKLSLGVTAAFGVIGAAAVAEFARFNKAMTQSTAIMGDMSDKTRKKMEELALSLSGEGLKSADELAKSFYYLASAGLNVEQQMVALPIAMKFATAGNFEMEKATQLLTSAQAALGLKTQDTTEYMKNMARVANVLVKADILAQGSVEQFSEALSNKAAAALRMANKDVEEGVAVLAAFAEQGLRGEAAGEALAIVLRDLQRTAITNKKAFDDLGISVFDAQGNMRNTADILKDLEDVMSGASVELRRTAFQLLGFHDRSLSALLSLIGFSERVRSFEKDLRAAGDVIGDVSDKQMKSFAAQWEITGNQLKNFLITLGETLAPALLELNQNLRDVIRWLVETQKESGWLTAILVTMIDVVKYFAFGVGLVWTALKSLAIILDVLVNRNLAQLEISVTGQIKLLKIWWNSISAVIDGLMALGGVAEGASKVMASLLDRDFAGAAAAYVKMQFERVNAVKNAFRAVNDGVTESLDVLKEARQQSAEVDKKFVDDSKNAVKDLIGEWGTFMKFAVAVFPALDPGLKNMTKNLDDATKGTKELEKAVLRVGDAAKGGGEKIQRKLNDLQMTELLKLLGQPPRSELFSKAEAQHMRDITGPELMDSMKLGQQGELSSERTADMLRAHGIIGHGTESGGVTQDLFSDRLVAQESAIAREIEMNENKLRILTEIEKKGIDMGEKANKEKLAAMEAYNRRLHQLQLAQAQVLVQAGQNMFDELGKAIESFGGRQTAAYKAMFAASKAMSIATSAIKIQQGIAEAIALPWPANIAAIATVVAAAASIVSTIQSVNLEITGAKAAGGLVSRGQSYLVGERGPEIFSPSSNGTIVPNDKIGGDTRVVINNYTDVRPEVRERNEGDERIVEVILRRVKGEISSEIRDGRGDVTRSMESSYRLKRGQ